MDEAVREVDQQSDIDLRRRRVAGPDISKAMSVRWATRRKLRRWKRMTYNVLIGYAVVFLIVLAALWSSVPDARQHMYMGAARIINAVVFWN